jgi:uncharacterized Fe-S cluster-containing radical SAM superfamily protein
MVKNAQKVCKQLVLIITRKCNLQCFFCPQAFSSTTLKTNYALKAIHLYLRLESLLKKLHLRIFGGEPLLELDLVVKILDKFFSSSIGTADITTNATLLNKEGVKILKKFPRLEVIVNSHTLMKFSLQKLRLISQLPIVTFNIIFIPGKCKEAFESFIFLLKKGFRRFNFLPVYFTYWNEEEIKDLRTQFLKISNIINSSKEFFYIKNKYVFSQIPLFNQVLTIDVNGDIFSTNLILDKNFFKYRNRFFLGNISTIDNFLDCMKKKTQNLFNFFKKKIDKEIFNSTLKVDGVLTEFVNTIS